MAFEKNDSSPTTAAPAAPLTGAGPGAGPGHGPVTHTDRIHAKVQSMRYVYNKMTWPLFSTWMISALVNIIFGYETTSFGGVQSIPAFVKQFGDKTAKGTYVLSAARASYTSSTAFAGKLIGALISPYIVERWGHRIAFWILVVVVWIGVIIEASSKNIAQFIVGRIIIYFRFGHPSKLLFGLRLIRDEANFAAGDVALVLRKWLRRMLFGPPIFVAPVSNQLSKYRSYQSEIVPAAMRGTVVGSIQLFNLFGQIYASGVNRGFSTSTSPSGYIYFPPPSKSTAVSIRICFLTAETVGSLPLQSRPRFLSSSLSAPFSYVSSCQSSIDRD